VQTKALGPRQVAFAAMIGTALEGYEYFLYTFVAAVVFGPVFFPTFHPWLGTLAAISAHAAAFFVRPLGALLFGRIGDRFGRRPALVVSLVVMGVATVSVGLLPTYAVLGVAAPVLLVLLRLIQGVSIGGEIPGAVLIGVEHAPPERRTFYGAFAHIGISIGFLIVGMSLLIVTTVVGPETFQRWGWRIPFLFSAVLVVIGLYLRRRLTETPEFLEAESRIGQERTAGRLGTLFRRAGRPLLTAILMWTGPTAFFYAFLTSLLAYTKNFVPELGEAAVQWGLAVTSVVLVTITFVSAYYGNRWGRPERVIIISGVWMTLWAAPAYLLINLGSVPALFLAMLVGSVSLGIFTGVAPARTAALFPVEVRYLGVGVTITISVLIGGAVLPLPALALVGTTGGSVVPMIAMIVIAGVATTIGGIMARRLGGAPGPRVADGTEPGGDPATRS